MNPLIELALEAAFANGDMARALELIKGADLPVAVRFRIGESPSIITAQAGIGGGLVGNDLVVVFNADLVEETRQSLAARVAVEADDDSRR